MSQRRIKKALMRWMGIKMLRKNGVSQIGKYRFVLSPGRKSKA